MKNLIYYEVSFKVQEFADDVIYKAWYLAFNEEEAIKIAVKTGKSCGLSKYDLSAKPVEI